jgi:hypothetical protein
MDDSMLWALLTDNPNKGDALTSGLSGSPSTWALLTDNPNKGDLATNLFPD